MPSAGILSHEALLRTDVSMELGIIDSCHTYDCGVTFLRNVGSYKSHTL
jgi:hypothetical protein